MLCSPIENARTLYRLAAEHGVADSIRFVTVEHSRFGAWCYAKDLLHLHGYRQWHGRAIQRARRLHAKKPFDLVHQVNFCGFREPGFGWTLGLPFVWGPVGGTQNFPLRYLGLTCPLSGAREVLRNAVNSFQLRHSSRLQKAARHASTVLAATRCAQRDLRCYSGIEAGLELEAGLDHDPLPPRMRRDPAQPIRLLWTGRLRAWKGLPLLLRAAAKLPADVPFELRVLGEGACESSYKKLAEKLGIADRTQWVGWGDYPTTLPHYEWADLFVFTSLRDTSGAGLLEALAAGAPIIGLDHQGAADIMSPSCAVPIPLSHPSETIDRIQAAIARLAQDPDRHLRLSRGAQQRAHAFVWRKRVNALENLYSRVLSGDATIAHVDDHAEDRAGIAESELSALTTNTPVMEQAG
ncbi:MAG: glycosyltransferase family 4 protein [Planctomycetales bacterium]|nr:glycosyltransferase family 4 protein [Planctomycetales bacterium]